MPSPFRLLATAVLALTRAAATDASFLAGETIEPGVGGEVCVTSDLGATRSAIDDRVDEASVGASVHGTPQVDAEVSVSRTQLHLARPLSFAPGTRFAEFRTTECDAAVRSRLGSDTVSFAVDVERSDRAGFVWRSLDVGGQLAYEHATSAEQGICVIAIASTQPSFAFLPRLIGGAAWTIHRDGLHAVIGFPLTSIDARLTRTLQLNAQFADGATASLCRTLGRWELSLGGEWPSRWFRLPDEPRGDLVGYEAPLVWVGGAWRPRAAVRLYAKGGATIERTIDDTTSSQRLDLGWSWTVAAGVAIGN